VTNGQVGEAKQLEVHHIIISRFTTTQVYMCDNRGELTTGVPSCFPASGSVTAAPPIAGSEARARAARVSSTSLRMPFSSCSLPNVSTSRGAFSASRSMRSVAGAAGSAVASAGGRRSRSRCRDSATCLPRAAMGLAL